ncbi:unnamed protein product, partial [Musa hybrid cultivar]
MSIILKPYSSLLIMLISSVLLLSEVVAFILRNKRMMKEASDNNINKMKAGKGKGRIYSRFGIVQGF